MSKKLLVVADDYGVHDIVDIGIIKCIKKGAVDCVDMIVTRDDFKERFQNLLTCEKCSEYIKTGQVKLGLHLTLTCGRPCYLKDEDYLQKIASKKNGEYTFKYNSAEEILPHIIAFSEVFTEALQNEILEQCKRFEDITGRKPQHISSHEGVFQANRKMYYLYSEVVRNLEIPMRCPALISYDPEHKGAWKKNPEQKFLPNKILLATNGVLVLPWIRYRNQQKRAFDNDRNAEMTSPPLISTDFFIEHFFQNASKINLKKILIKIMNHPYKYDINEQISFEMVVHPVSYQNASELESIPPGINNSEELMQERKKEMLILSQPEFLRTEMKKRGIEKYELPDGNGVKRSLPLLV